MRWNVAEHKISKDTQSITNTSIPNDKKLLWLSYEISNALYQFKRETGQP